MNAIEEILQRLKYLRQREAIAENHWKQIRDQRLALEEKLKGKL